MYNGFEIPITAIILKTAAGREYYVWALSDKGKFIRYVDTGEYSKVK